ncbi:uncharacterized protein LOC127007934 [Eriocheir sinensis]|uniref:uncharacterized protein LOC127007934 n=1 Tax=Eriocheir sinensis TaxID=95602 RepID=UPI0021C7753A|nr:uncharacterized protein LOC127007934 [Eriocheir sinensis]
MEENSTLLVCSSLKHDIPFLSHALPPHAHTRTNAHSLPDALSPHKHAYTHPHAHVHAHNDTPPAFDFPFIDQASSALLPLLICAALCSVTLALRRAPRHKGQAEGAWVRPLSSLAEVVSAVGALFGSFNMAQVLWLTSPRPITQEQVHKAFTHIAQRVEVLRLAVAWRWLWPWFRRMPRVEVDLAVVEGDPEAVCEQQLAATYDMAAGPLWRVRLVPLPPQRPGQHRAALVFSFHHAVSDGTTNILVIKDLLHTLNAAATGRDPIVPARPLMHSLTARTATPRGWIATFTFVLAATRTAITTAVSSHSLTSLLPPHDSRQFVTKLLHHDLSEEATQQLLKQCRGAGVRVHSCITTAASLAMKRTTQHFAGRRQESLEVIQEQVVNLRRFHKEQTEATGSMAVVMLQRHAVHDDPEAFWPLARAMQARLDHNLEQRRAPLRSGALIWLVSGIVPINVLLAWLGLPSFNYSHIGYSNMGDLRRLLGPAEDAEDAPVQLSGVLRTVSNELLGSLCFVNCHTLDGRLSLSLDYFPNKMSGAAARLMFTHLTHALTHLAASGSPSPPPASGAARGCNGNG